MPVREHGGGVVVEPRRDRPRGSPPRQAARARLLNANVRSMRRTGILAIALALLLAAPARRPDPADPDRGSDRRPDRSRRSASSRRSRCRTRPTTPGGSATSCLRPERAHQRGPSSARSSPTGARPQHADDQLRDVRGARPRQPRAAPAARRYFKDASSACRPGTSSARYSPRGRRDDRARPGPACPTSTGTTRAGTMFGARIRGRRGPAVLHGPRCATSAAGKLSSFAGGATGPGRGAVGERALHRGGPPAPGRAAAEPRRRGAPDRRRRRGLRRRRQPVHRRGKLDPTKMPGEYAAIGHPLGPEPRSAPTSSPPLAGRRHLRQGRRQGASVAALAGRARARYGASRRAKASGRSSAPPRTRRRPHRPQREVFPYRRRRGSWRRAAGRLPPRLAATDEVAASKSGAQASASAHGLLDGRSASPKRGSNALVVSGPRLRLRPAARRLRAADRLLRPADADGAGCTRPLGRGSRHQRPRRRVPGVNLYVQLGRGPDYAWSATSSSQDIIDTFAVPLCHDDNHYRVPRQVHPDGAARATNALDPEARRPDPAGIADAAAPTARRSASSSAAATIERQAGAVHAAALDLPARVRLAPSGVRGSTTPTQISDARDFQRAATEDRLRVQLVLRRRRDIAYINSGANPVRAKGAEPRTSRSGPRSSSGRGRPRSWHLAGSRRRPAAAGRQPGLHRVSWNNKQAPGFSGADSNEFSSVYRSQMLEDRVKRA